VEFRFRETSEPIIMRIDQISCLFPLQKEVRNIVGWTIKVHEDDWEKVYQSFRLYWDGVNETEAT